MASTNPACSGWAFGMTKYLAHYDPNACVQWAFEFIRPYLSDSGEYGGVVTRSIQFLRDVLNTPETADLKQMEEFAWEPWNHRSATCGGGPLARLVWAAMGVVELLRPGQAAHLSDSEMFSSGKDHSEIAAGLVWYQSATTIHMIAHDRPEVPEVTAVAFTQKVCFLERPQNCVVESRVEWAWSGIVYEIATLRTPHCFYLQFTDSSVDEKLFSGPFTSMDDVDDHMELLKHAPKTIRFVPVKHDER
jgi:hypothetical protein